ncbi:MAG TPA: chromosome partitioning protein ParB, partial [Armatimonadetes bacterium]|nr:chromosome partitioning protein ParB [Armatimonadota bacterium]
MDKSIKLGFEMECLEISISSILPGRVIDDRVRKSAKYASILSSIQEIGLIEPLAVYPLKQTASSNYMLLDGHLRMEALKELGYESVSCLISTDDEAYTYNHKVNRLVPIQEHFMIMRALERGVSEARIAKVLQVDVARIREKRNLLRDICPEAVEILKNMPISASAIKHLRKVKPLRQVEIAELMQMLGNYEASYCQTLVTTTPADQMVDSVKTRKNCNISPEELARMQRELDTLQHNLQMREDSYGENFLNLVVIRGYLSKLLSNERVVHYLSSNHADLVKGLQQITASA